MAHSRGAASREICATSCSQAAIAARNRDWSSAVALAATACSLMDVLSRFLAPVRSVVDDADRLRRVLALPPRPIQAFRQIDGAVLLMDDASAAGRHVEIQFADGGRA